MKYKKLNFETHLLPFRFRFENGVEVTNEFEDFDSMFNYIKDIFRRTRGLFLTNSTIIINDEHSISINAAGDITLKPYEPCL